MPEVSVIMPICNGARHLRESLDSVIGQTFKDWELLAVNEYGSDDGSADIVEEYAASEPRIKLLQNTERLGLAASLNKGFRLARGKYLARLDSDDLALPQRFEKQVSFLEDAPEIGICGSYQHHFGKGVDWVHKPPIRPQDMKAALIFSCNLCHTTLMLRSNVVRDNGLYYDSSFLAEDFELWTRAILVTQIANIPEVLGEYRQSGRDNITAQKREGMIKESRQIVAKALKTVLGIELEEDQTCFFQGWENFFYTAKNRKAQLIEFEKVLRKIYQQNEMAHALDRNSLLNQLTVEWRHAKFFMPLSWGGEELAGTIDDVFSGSLRTFLPARYKLFQEYNPSFIARARKIAGLLERIVSREEDQIGDRSETK